MVILASKTLVPHTSILALAAILLLPLVEARRRRSQPKRYALSPNISINIVEFGMPTSNRSHPVSGCDALTNTVCSLGLLMFQIDPYVSVILVYFEVVAAPAALVLTGIISIEVNNAKQ